MVRMWQRRVEQQIILPAFDAYRWGGLSRGPWSHSDSESDGESQMNDIKQCLNGCIAGG
jgi:hypothetical protein